MNHKHNIRFSSSNFIGSLDDKGGKKDNDEHDNARRGEDDNGDRRNITSGSRYNRPLSPL